MEVSFLNVTAPEAIDIIEDCMNKGYETLDRIRASYEAHKAISTNSSSEWSEWVVAWINETLGKLGQVYNNKHRLYTFREAKTERYSTTGDMPYTGIENTIEAKISVLKGYYDFIMTRSQITINYNGNINYQIGDNNNNEQS